MTGEVYRHCLASLWLLAAVATLWLMTIMDALWTSNWVFVKWTILWVPRVIHSLENRSITSGLYFKIKISQTIAAEWEGRGSKSQRCRRGEGKVMRWALLLLVVGPERGGVQGQSRVQMAYRVLLPMHQSLVHLSWSISRCSAATSFRRLLRPSVHVHFVLVALDEQGRASYYSTLLLN